MEENDTKIIIAEFKDNKLNICDYLNELNEDSPYEYIQKQKEKINAQNYVLVSDEDVNNFNSSNLSLKDLNEHIKNNHSEYNLNFIELKSSASSFIDSSEDFVKVVNDNIDNKQNNNSNFTPKEFVTSFNNSINEKLKELNTHKNMLSKNKHFNKKTLLACGGIFALGVVIPVLSPIVTPIAVAIGAASIVNTTFGRPKEVKDTISQINLLKKATKNIVGDYKFESSFDEQVEVEFLKLCQKQNVKINQNIFPILTAGDKKKKTKHI